LERKYSKDELKEIEAATNAASVHAYGYVRAKGLNLDTDEGKGTWNYVFHRRANRILVAAGIRRPRRWFEARAREINSKKGVNHGNFVQG
jgi:hypothetical protein